MYQVTKESLTLFYDERRKELIAKKLSKLLAKKENINIKFLESQKLIFHLNILSVHNSK